MAKRPKSPAPHRLYNGHTSMTRFFCPEPSTLRKIEQDAGINLPDQARQSLASAISDYVTCFDLQETAPRTADVRRAAIGRSSSDSAQEMANNMKTVGDPLPPTPRGRPPNEMLRTFLDQLIEIFEASGEPAQLKRADFDEEEGGFRSPATGLGRTTFTSFVEGVQDLIEEQIPHTGDSLLWAMYKYLRMEK
jgi:hypothetical protein